MSATFSQYFFPFDHPHTLFAFRTRKCGSMRSTLWTDPNVLCTKDRPNRIESQDSRSIRCCANGCTLASSSLSLSNAHIRDCSYGEHRMHACMPECASECAVLCLCFHTIQHIQYYSRALEPIEIEPVERFVSSLLLLFVRITLCTYIKRQLQRQNHRWPTRVGNILGSSFPRVVNTTDVV